MTACHPSAATAPPAICPRALIPEASLPCPLNVGSLMNPLGRHKNASAEEDAPTTQPRGLIPETLCTYVSLAGIPTVRKMSPLADHHTRPPGLNSAQSGSK